MPIRTENRVTLDPEELEQIQGLSLELIWRIIGNGPYKHFPSKPHIFQEDIQEKVRGIGRHRAGLIYQKLVKEV